MLIQLHWQNKKNLDVTEFVAQIEEPETGNELREFVKIMAEKHPIPDGYAPMICNENSLYFIKTGEETPINADV